MDPLPPHVKPRAHHYMYAHVILRDSAFLSKDGLPTYGAMGLVGLALKGKLRAHVIDEWTQVGTQLPPDEERIPPTGIEAEFLQLAGHDAALVTLPPPERASEAHYVVIAHHGARPEMRYFTLERSFPTESGEPTAVVAEWLGPDKGRVNYGALTAPDREAFMTRLSELLESGPPPQGQKKRKRFGLF
ncbi:hypothetical protein [Actinomadura fibrosa]|uniref:Uncharacterized protein n=1 Tax=Actinomadura fibrosa TaxID=111802 RepID=A0ABW2XBX6_9ACTN|nr:hypothetical protein [Actinomadura fibrosa]